MSTCEVFVNSVATAGWAWSGGKGVEQYVLDEEMLHNSLQKRVGIRDAAAEWIVYVWIVVVVHSEDFLDLSLYLSCMFELPNHDVEILVKILGSECLFKLQITLSLL